MVDRCRVSTGEFIQIFVFYFQQIRRFPIRSQSKWMTELTSKDLKYDNRRVFKGTLNRVLPAASVRLKHSNRIDFYTISPFDRNSILSNASRLCNGQLRGVTERSVNSKKYWTRIIWPSITIVMQQRNTFMDRSKWSHALGNGITWMMYWFVWK